jgi:hypothetical protein
VYRVIVGYEQSSRRQTKECPTLIRIPMYGFLEILTSAERIILVNKISRKQENKKGTKEKSLSLL